MNRIIDLREGIDDLAQEYPYVLVDKIIEMDPEKRMLKALKGASNTEPYYAGHFPDNPTMPGVLLLMAFSQAAGLLYGGEGVLLTSIEKARFQRPVHPGERLIVTVQEIERTSNTRVVQCLGEVEGKTCIKGKLYFSAAGG